MFLNVSRKVDLRTVSFDVPPQEVIIWQWRSFVYLFVEICKLTEILEHLRQIVNKPNAFISSDTRLKNTPEL